MQVKIKDSGAVITGLSHRQAQRLVDAGEAVPGLFHIRVLSNVMSPDLPCGFTMGDVVAVPTHMPARVASDLIRTGYAVVAPPDKVPERLRKPRPIPRDTDQPPVGVPDTYTPADHADNFEDLMED